MEIWRSFIASSSADWVFGVARLISSVSRKLVKNRAGFELKIARPGVVDGDAENVAGQACRRWTAGALEGAIDRARQGLRQRGLTHAGHIFNQQVAARQQADHREPDDVALAADDGVEARLPVRRASFRAAVAVSEPGMSSTMIAGTRARVR